MGKKMGQKMGRVKWACQMGVKWGCLFWGGG